MTKILTGSTISYGSLLPTTGSTVDGSLFFLTEGYTHPTTSVVYTPGLYLYNFQEDINSLIVGAQVGQTWQQLTSQNGYVLKAGDSMSGPLTITGTTAATAFGTAAWRLNLQNRNNSGGWSGIAFSKDAGTAVASIIENGGGAGVGQLSFSTAPAGTLLERLRITSAGLTQVIQSGTPYTVWHAGNMGAASGLDADLLDGQQGTYYLNLANSNGNLDINTRTSGVLSTSRGGTGGTLPTLAAGAIVFGLSSTTFGSNAVGTTGQVLLSGGTGAPTWLSPGSLTVGAASSLATARTITLSGGVTGSVSFNGTANVTIVTTAPYVLKAGDTMTGALNLPSMVVGSVGAVPTTGTVYISAHVGVGTTTTGGVAIRSSANAVNTGYIEFTSANSNRQGYIGFSTSTGAQDQGQIPFVMASANFTGDVVAYSSDARLKTNISVIPNALEKIGTLGGYEYDWDMEKTRRLGFYPKNKHEHGLLAQEVQKVLPDAVVPAPFNDEYLTVKYERLVALLVAGMTEQQEQLNELRREIDSLRMRM